ncbi:hypothetical protein BDQ17DRAFT_1441621 [Cyathus striatus]|nr:hypothetical protein BDQ17DRAFT_1441621 [Cyathus striatus]
MFSILAYGEYNDLVREVAGARGHTLATWDFESKQAALTEIANSHPSTILALNHDVYEQTAHASSLMLQFQAKATFVTSAECSASIPMVGAPSSHVSNLYVALYIELTVLIFLDLPGSKL